jgi:phosphatidylglycerophosphatase A
MSIFMTEKAVEPETGQTDSLMIRARQIALGSPDGFLAFGLGSGLLTRAPGTMGTLVAVPFALLLPMLDGFSFAAFILVAFLGGCWICGRVAERLGVEDYGGIVWDEMVGYWIAVAWVPLEWYWLLAGFVLFRFFDIVKPWPIDALDAKIEGGFGIMLDDVVAGVYTAILLAGAEAAFFVG